MQKSHVATFITTNKSHGGAHSFVENSYLCAENEPRIHWKHEESVRFHSAVDGRTGATGGGGGCDVAGAVAWYWHLDHQSAAWPHYVWHGTDAALGGFARGGESAA